MTPPLIALMALLALIFGKNIPWSLPCLSRLSCLSRRAAERAVERAVECAVGACRTGTGTPLMNEECIPPVCYQA